MTAIPGVDAPPARPAPPSPSDAARRRRRWRHLPQYAAISPFFVLFAVFGLYPVLYSLYLALQRWDGVGPKKFVGLENFRYLLTDGQFWDSIGNTLLIWVMSTVPMTVLALLIALGLNSSIRFKGALRIAYFMPNVTSIVAMSLVFGSIFSGEFGILNWFLGLFGLGHVPWLADPWAIRSAIAIMIVWRWTGYNAIIFLTGLQALPTDVYEAARIDGAGPVQTFFRITLPLLRPVLLFSLVMSAIGGLQTFTESQVLLGDRGGPGAAGMTMVLYFYGTAFADNDFGYGAAIAWGIFVVVVLFAILNWRLVQRPDRGQVTTEEGGR
ncbi:cytochrome c biogenesis protein [Streptomyces sulfonofaciens]|uniref:Cytochrome c biogenesis protein n=1 Tax=Streptomyces sulfonofaciens TaxID=68272 RepID=A0A919KY83_9ACTN|nr:sugar ABC transporter permease [Streptomyces sulfonofaciens]GHH77083.1 cytochrome c biogenesis protein [Streptomyces sulfonofaciens]